MAQVDDEGIRVREQAHGRDERVARVGRIVEITLLQETDIAGQSFDAMDPEVGQQARLAVFLEPGGVGSS